MPHDVDVIDEVLNRYGCDPSNLVMILQDLQNELNYLPAHAIERAALKLGIPRSQIYSAASFYKTLSLEPRGKHQVDICMGTACHVRGAERLVNQLSDELGIEPGETTEDLEVSLNTVHCVGACALGPLAVMDGEFHGEMTPRRLSKALHKCCSGDSAKTSSPMPVAVQAAIDLGIERLSGPDALEHFRITQQKEQAGEKALISICAGSGCRALGSNELFTEFSEAIEAAGLGEDVRIQRNGCHGFCERGLICVIRPAGILYQKVTPKDVGEIVERTLKNGEVIERLLYVDPKTDEKIVHEGDIPFYARQQRHLMSQNAHIDPLNIVDYIADGGYSGLSRALFEMSSEAVIEEVRSAGLRGRGGGGFHAARKWDSCRKSPAGKKYILCNADEGDPGAFMDCALLEGNPHSIIEGMIIGAYAIAGSDAEAQGYIYIRNEYPIAVAHLEVALDQARAAGLLGQKILGSNFSYDIKISRGGGAFVCGESTALMASIEGKIGEPRAKYVHTSTSGLYESPTVLNNVESWANVPLIIREGAEAFSAVGTKTCSGTKIFSLVGKVNNTGLVEVPMGISLREIVFEIGGGIRDGKCFKAVQTGGPSGGCIPESLLDLPVDFDELAKVGSMMGSGGMIVMDEDTCMVDVVRYFISFLAKESCGKCAACRLGLDQLKQILDRICAGEGRPEDIPAMEKLFTVLDEGSLCGLGKSAANPVRSTLTHFRDEYDAHILDKACPAGVCRSLITYVIDESCTGCTLCVAVCPQQAITGVGKERHVLDIDKCDRCGLCVASCNFDSIITVTRDPRDRLRVHDIAPNSGVNG
jgi:NADH-quinone oxidoreductase subunit F